MTPLRVPTAARTGAAATLAGATAVQFLRTLRSHPPGGAARWTRANARGRPVSLLAGPAYAVAAVTGTLAAPLPARTRTATILAVGAAAGLGVYDDLAGSGADRGLRGHLAALRDRRVTTGTVKVLGLAGAGLAAGVLLRRRPLDVLLAGGVVAGSANLANLLDLRPGRAIKAALLAGAPRLATAGAPVAAPALAAAAALLPADLAEEVMLGDGGANAIGAALGVAAAASSSRRALAGQLAVLAGLTLASERVSFTAVIARTPGLRELDALGRLP